MDLNEVNNTQVPQVNEPVDNTVEEDNLIHEEIGEHDIVIDDDFELDIQVTKIKPIIQSAPIADQQPTPQPAAQVQQPFNIGSEQSGNITF